MTHHYRIIVVCLFCVLGGCMVLVLGRSIWSMTLRRSALEGGRLRAGGSCEPASLRNEIAAMLDGGGARFGMQDPIRTVPTREQEGAIRRAFGALENAYTNGCVRNFKDLAATLPDSVSTLPDGLFLEVSRSFAECYKQDVVRLTRVDVPMTREEIDRRMELCLSATRLQGELLLKREDYCTWLIHLEARMYDSLKQCRDVYRMSNNDELSRRVDWWLKEWICKMDGSDGLSRAFAFHMVDRLWSAVERGEEPRSYPLERVMYELSTLSRKGYTPSWLDELKRYCETKEIDRSGVDVCPP